MSKAYKCACTWGNVYVYIISNTVYRASSHITDSY